MKTDWPLTKKEFDYIYSRVPRLNVEVLLYNKIKGIYLTLRDIEPCKGQWHLPGGTVFYSESLNDAVIRIAKREIGIDVTSSKMVGYIEYYSHYKFGNDHPVGLVFIITQYTGQPKVNNEASDGQWFSELPNPIHIDQEKFLIQHRYIKRR